jgi:hypothetical protein
MLEGKRPEPEALVLERMLSGMAFPASLPQVVNHLALIADAKGGGRAVELHDLIIQLDVQEFESREALHRAIREYHAWEREHLLHAG